MNTGVLRLGSRLLLGALVLILVGAAELPADEPGETSLSLNPLPSEELILQFPTFTGLEQERAALTLAFREERAGVPVIVGALGSATGRDQAALAMALARFDQSVTLPELLPLLEAGTPGQQAGAIMAIGEYRDPALLEHTRRFLTAENPRVRYAAAMACAHMKCDDATPTLLDLLAADDQEVQVAALDALEALKYTGAVRPLTRAFLKVIKGDNDYLKYRYLLALGQFPGDETVDAVTEVEGRLPPHLRRWAPWVLGRTGSPKAVPALTASMGHPDPEVRFAATEALGAFDDQTATVALLRAFKKTSGDAQWTAAAALAEHPTRVTGEDRELLIGYLLDRAKPGQATPDRLKALPLLGRFQDAPAAATLEPWLAQETNDRVKAEMEAALEGLKGTR